MSNVIELPLDPGCTCVACGLTTNMAKTLKVESSQHGTLYLMLCSDCALGHAKELFTLAANYITQLEDGKE